MKKSFLLFAALLILSLITGGSAFAQVSTTVTMSGTPIGGSPFSSLAAAITAVNGLTITGPVVVTAASGGETAPAGGYSITATGDATNTIIIQGTTTTTITAGLQVAGVQSDAIFKIIGGDYITIQNFTMQENSGNTVITPIGSQTMTEYGVALFLTTATNGAQNNTIQNNIISLNSTYPNAIGILSTSSNSSTHGTLEASATTGTNSNNKFYNNTISSVAYGMYFICPPITATVFESGIDIGGTSAGTGNNITFGNATTATFTNLNRFSAVLPAGITFRNGGAGSNVRYNTIASNSLTYAQSGGLGGIVTTIGTAATGVTYTTTWSNNSITLTNNGTTAIYGMDYGYGLSTGTIVGSNNTIDITNTTVAAASAAIMGIRANYASATNTLNTNTITTTQNPTTTGSITRAVTGITAAGVGTTVTVNSNIITFKQSAPTGTASYGSGAMTYIDVGASSGTVNVNSNQLLTTGSTIRSTGTCIGVNHTTGTITVGITINLNTITIDRVAASGTITGTNESTTPSTVAHTITNNAITFTNLSGTSVANGINTLGGVSATGTVKAINSNTINISGTHSGTSIGIQAGYSYGTMNNNSVTISSAGPTVVGYQATSTGAGAYTMTENSLSLTSSTTSPTSMIGFNVGATGPFQIYSNTFTAMNFTGIITGSPVISGIAVAAGNGNNIYNNNITNITIGAATSSASPVIRGIALTGGTLTNVYKNRIFGISTPSTGTGTLVSGITISAGTTNYVYNNYISDLNATATTGATITPFTQVNGIYITSTTTLSTIGLYYNTIFLNASSSGTPFGSSGIYHTTSTVSTTAALDMRNNIIVNNSTPAGTGLTVAYRRSSTTLTNYASTSNYNDFHGGTPGASNLIFNDGTNSDQTMATYKSRVTPRDGSSFRELPPFVDITTKPYDLHLQTTVNTQCESGGSTVSTPNITDDYDGHARYPNSGYPDRVDYPATAPDVGADEFAGIPSDQSPPTIIYTVLGNIPAGTERELNNFAAITDASGVNTNDYKPRIYYKKSTDNNAYVGNTADDNGWKWMETPGDASPFSFTIDYSILYNGGGGGGGSVSEGDVIQYFVTAEDLAPTPNVGINSGTFAKTPSHCALESGDFPIGGTINNYTIVASISGTFTVGAAGDYATLTAAVADYNSKYQSGPVVFSLIDATYSGETLPITINQNPGADATNTLTIKPAGSTTPTISGSSTSAVIKLNGADYVIIDGSNTSKGTDRSLTIENTGTGTNTCAVWVSSLGENAGATNNIIKNCMIKAGSNSVTSTFGIFVGGTSISTSGTGADNDNLTIQNNEIIKCYYAIYARGAGTGTTGQLNGLNITKNKIGSSSASDYVLFKGVDIQNATSPVISKNEIFNLQLSTSVNNAGIDIGQYVTDADIYQNKIYGLRSTSTSGWGTYGINIASGTGVTGIKIYNNIIYDLITSNYSAISTTYNAFGIRITGGTNHKIYYNSVNLFGTPSGGSSAGMSAAFVITSSTATGIDLRNNIFTNSTEFVYSGSKSYCAYVVTGTTFGTINYNDYYASGTYGILGYYGADKTTLTEWATSSGGDGNSLNANPEYQSNTNLQPNLGASVLAAGTPITGITTDYLGVTRSGTTPSIGAYENGADVSGPTITYTALQNTTSTSNRTLDDFAEITDPSGVNVSDYKPRIYYKKSTDNNTYVGNTSSDNGWKYTETPSGSTPFSFTIDYNIINGGSVSINDVIQYFIVAQDLQVPPYVGINSGVFNSTPSDVQLTSSAFPLTGTIRSYTILGGISGTKTVGTAGDYTTLTGTDGLFADINGKVLTGNLTVNIISNITEPGTVALNQFSEEPQGSNYTITIQPDAATQRTLSGTYAGGLIRLNGADRVTFDGRYSGSGNYLTIENTSTSSATGAIMLISLGNGLGATNNTIRNCNIKAGTAGTGSTYTYGIHIGGSTLTSTPSTGADNNNNTIKYNNISRSFCGIGVSGTTTNPSTGLTIEENYIGSSNASEYNGKYGTYLAYCTGATILSNTIFNQIGATTTPIGLNLGTDVLNSQISKNNINNITYTGTGGYGGRGMYISVGSTNCGLTFDNNVIYKIGGDGWSTFAGSSMVGMYFDGTTGGVNIYYNSVYLSGEYARSTATLTAAILFNTTTVTNVDLRNNIFQNSMNNTTVETDKNYAIYSTAPNTSFANINYNDYYANGPQGILGYLGGDQITLAAWQGASGGDGNSLNADPLYNSTTVLQPQTGSPVLAAGTPISGITTDILGISRSGTTPSMGAYEQGRDGAPPEITYTPLANTTSTSNRTLSDVTITDALSGVDWTNLPRIYYKKSTDANAFVGNTSSDNGWKYTTANVGSSPTNFTINYSIIYGGAVSQGDYVQYFVVAQDLETTPNVGSNPSAGFEGTSVSSITSAPTTPNQYKVTGAPLGGTYTVGIGDFNKYTGKNLYYKFFTRKVQMQIEVQNDAEQDVVNDNTPESVDILDFGSDNSKTKSEKSDNNNYRTEDKNITRDEKQKAPAYKTIEVEEKYAVLYEGDKPYEGPTVVYSDDPIFKKSGTRGDEPRGVYTTITEAVADAVERGIFDDVIFSLVDTDYPSEIFPITVTAINGASADNTVTIKPASSTSMRIFGENSTAIFLFDGAAYFNIDGEDPSSAGTKNLWIYNNHTTAPVIKLINGSNNIIIENCRIIGRNTSSTTTLSGLIHIGASTAADGNSYNTIKGNVIRDSVDIATSYYSGIYSYGTASKLNSYNRIEGNYISNFTYVGVYVYLNSGDGWVIKGNHLYNNRTTPPTGTAYPIDINSSSSNADSVLNNYIGGKGPYCTGGNWENSGAVAFYGMYLTVGDITPAEVHGNVIKNILKTNTGTGIFKGLYLYDGSYNCGTLTGNTIDSVVIAGTSSPYGIHAYTTSNIANNTIKNIRSTHSTAAPWVYGIYLQGDYAINCYNNQIYNIGFNTGAANTSNAYAAGGIYQYGTATTYGYNVYNNVISLGNDGQSHNLFLIGIGVTGATGTYNNYYNSVCISGTAEASNTRGSYGIWKSAAGTVITKDNIFCDVRQNGSGGTAGHYAYYAGDVTNITSNYNDLYSSNSLTIGYYSGNQTFAGWQSASGQDANSISSDPLYISSLDLRPSTSSQVLDAGTPITGITTDILGVTRDGTTPSIGAYEEGVDVAGPDITYTLLSNTSSTSNRTLTANISDATGVPTSGTLVPRIYYNKNNGTWYSQPGTLVSGSGTNGTWDFVIVNSDMGGVAQSDVVYYYVIAQDICTPVNIASKPAGVVATDVNTIITPPTPYSYLITGAITGYYFAIGPSGPYGGYDATFADITTAVATLNVSDLTEDIIFELQPDYSDDTEVFPITFTQFSMSGGSFYATFRPQSEASGLETAGDPGTGNPLIYFNGADNIIFDGRAGGEGNKEWAIRNTRTASTIAETFLIQNDAKNISLKYLTIEGNNESTSGGVISVQGTNLVSGNDDILIYNNNIKNYAGENPNMCVWIYGQNNSSMTNDNIIIRKNNIYDFGRNAASTNPRGIAFGRCNNMTIDSNSIYRTTSYSAQGLAQMIVVTASGSGSGHTIMHNNIGGSAANCGGSAYTLTTTSSGIYVVDIFDISSQTSATTVSYNKIQNYNLTSTSDAAANSILFCGIFSRTTAGSVSIANNTIGDNTVNATTSPSIKFTANGASATYYSVVEGIDVRAGTGSISNNTIGGVQLLKASTRNCTFIGIYHGTSGTPNITNNTVGSPASSLDKITKITKNDVIQNNNIINNYRGETNNLKTGEIKQDIRMFTGKRSQCDFEAITNALEEIESVTKHVSEQKGDEADRIKKDAVSKSISGVNQAENENSVNNNLVSNTDNVIIPNISQETVGPVTGISSGWAGTISGNTVANIKINPTTSGSIAFTGISITNSSNSAYSNTVTDNTVRNIFSNATGGNSFGIAMTTNTAGTLTCTGNTVTDISLTAGTSGTATFAGISNAGTGGYNISTNTVKVFDSDANAPLNASGHNVFSGIYNTNSNGNTTNWIFGNNIFNITGNPNTAGTQIKLQGIFNNSSTSSGTVAKNKIYGFNTNSTNNTSMVCGYNSWLGASWTYSNNVFDLGSDITGDVIIYGVYDYSDNNTGNWYYNTFRISGTVSSGSANTSAYYRNSTTSNVTAMQNNYLLNTRTGGTGAHLCVDNAIGASGWTLSNYNNLYSAGSTVGRWTTTSNLTFDQWKTNSSKDANSISALVVFTGTNLLQPDITDNSCWHLNGTGTQIASVNEDILANPRSVAVNTGPTDIGAYEFTPDASTTPPEGTQVGTPGDGAVTLFYFGGRLLATITWHGTGPFPTIIPRYFSGRNPGGDTTDAFYGCGYFDFEAIGGESYSYDICLHFDPATLLKIQNIATLRLAKKPSGGSIWLTYLVQGTGAGQYQLWVPGDSVKVYGLTSFSHFSYSSEEAPLMVTLAGFQASVNQRDVKLDWITNIERNNSGFEIQRTDKGMNNWTRVGFVNGAGNSSKPVSYSFIDRKLNSGKYNYRLKQIDNNGHYTYYTLDGDIEVGLPTKYDLSQNYPNPFNPTTKIDFSLPFDSRVTIVIYDIAGREIMKLLNSDMRKAGFHTVTLNGSSLASGTYIYRFVASGNGQEYSMSKKMVLVK